jgi:hypothetical protein
MATTVIGITGKAGAGKDTLADRLVSHHGYTRLAFADPLKQLLLDINPIIDHDPIAEMGVTLRDLVLLYGWDDAKAIPQVRRLLQDTGEAMREYVGPDVWIMSMARRVSLVGGPVVIADVRYVNEARWVQGLGDLVRVVRPDLDDRDRHVSENELNNWTTNHVVVNDRDIAALHTSADFLADALRGAPSYFSAVG